MADGEIVLTLTIKTRGLHTAARERLLDVMRAFKRIAQECDEFTTLRVVGESPDVPVKGAKP